MGTDQETKLHRTVLINNTLRRNIRHFIEDESERVMNRKEPEERKEESVKEKISTTEIVNNSLRSDSNVDLLKLDSHFTEDFKLKYQELFQNNMNNFEKLQRTMHKSDKSEERGVI